MKRIFQKLKLAGAVIAIGLLPLSALAQGEPAAVEDAPPPGVADSNDNAGPPQEAQPLQQDDLPISQFLPKAEAGIVQMRSALTKGLEILRDARESKDAVRLTCVNDKITAMKGLLRISEDAYISLQEAMATNNTEKSRYELRRIEVSQKKMQELLSASLNCAGAEQSYSGGTEVEVDVDPALTNQDPYFGSSDPFYTPEDEIADGDTTGVGSDDPTLPRPPVVSAYR